MFKSWTYDSSKSGEHFHINPNVYNDNYFLAGESSRKTLHPQEFINNKQKFENEFEQKLKNKSHSIEDIAHAYLNDYLTDRHLNILNSHIAAELLNHNRNNLLVYNKMGLLNKDHRKILSNQLHKKIESGDIDINDINDAEKYGYMNHKIKTAVRDFGIPNIELGKDSSDLSAYILKGLSPEELIL